MNPERLPSTIATQRLKLRAPVASDARLLFDAYTRDPRVSRFMVWRPHASLAETQAFVDACIAGWEQGTRLPYVITEAAADAPIGMVEARIQGFTVDVGYVLAPVHWGKGYMPEAVSAIAQAALAAGHFRVQAFCDVENGPSRRTLEKAGFQLEGRLERYMVHPNVSAEPRTCFMFSRSR